MIEREIEQREKRLKSLYPVAHDAMRKKTNPELKLKAHDLHYYFIRFAFSVLSYALYLPAIIDEINNGNIIKAIIMAIILALLEIGLAYSAWNYYTLKHSENIISLTRSKIITFSLAIASMTLSGLSGVYAVDITDHSQEKIVEQTTNKKKQDLAGYYAMLNKNTKILDQNNQLIQQNNQHIADLKAVALTRKAIAQINSYNARNKELSAMNQKIIEQNGDLNKRIENTDSGNEKQMTERIEKASLRETIYMIIFFLAGLISVIGIMFSYNFIAEYKRDLNKEAAEIEAVKKMMEENLEKEKMETARRNKIAKELELENIRLQKAIDAARNESSTWEFDNDHEKKNQRLNR